MKLQQCSVVSTYAFPTYLSIYLFIYLFIYFFNS